MVERIAVVVPTIREESITRFLAEWSDEFAAYPDLRIFVVEDNPERSFAIRGDRVVHVAWDDIDRELGTSGWIIPRRTDGVRSFGYYQAYRWGADILINLDDDCYPVRKDGYLLGAFRQNLGRRVSTAWFNTLAGRVANHAGLYPRGLPYAARDVPVVLCHGLWCNIPDFDARTQLANPAVRVDIVEAEAAPVPAGVFFPMCGMNVAVRREVIPAFYFPLMGQDREGNAWGYHRFADIWCGIFVKKIIDHLGKAAVSGQPVVFHDRASNAEKNLALEARGLAMNEVLPGEVANIKLTGETFRECYVELAQKLPVLDDYFGRLKTAMTVWADLFE